MNLIFPNCIAKWKYVFHNAVQTSFRRDYPVLCWVALDRGARIAEILEKLDYAQPWRETAGEIRQDILYNGWNEELGAFTQYYGGQSLYASNFLMEAYGFIEALDPKYVAKVQRTREEFCRDGLMHRYRNEDDHCSFPIIANVATYRAT